MAFTRTLRLLAASFLGLSGLVHASTLTVSASGKFSSPAGNQAGQLWAPNATWAFSFNVNSSQAVTNTTAVSFDIPVSQFTYTLNGVSVATAASFITFDTSSNLGLFTLYFGPESGYLNGSPIPEFLFEGAQAFSGTTASPTFSAGTFAETEWIYSDAVNYDANNAPTGVVTLTATPEPASGLLIALPLIALAFSRVRRSIFPN